MKPTVGASRGWSYAAAMAMREVAINGGRPAEHLGRACVEFDADAPVILPQGSIELTDGSVELELAVADALELARGAEAIETGS